MAILRSIIDWIVSIFSRPAPAPNPPPIPPTPQPDPQPLPENPIDQIRRQLLDLHNQERSRRGLSSLARNEALERASQKHNDWMAARGNLTHNEPGRDVGRRVNDEGYRWSWVGENIAYGQRNAEEVMDAWMNSSGHRANIINGNFSEVGFGVTQDKNGTWWWTTDFAHMT